MNKRDQYSSFGRSSPEELSKQISYFNSDSSYHSLFDKVPELILILNNNREVVFANKKTKSILGLEDINDIYGERPGEIFGCMHSRDELSGCGDSKSCKFCGAVMSIKKGLAGSDNENECVIITKDNVDAYQMRVFSSHFTIEDSNFVVFTLSDISDTKRKEVLEKLFFHDIMNTATGISTLSYLLNVKLPDKYMRYKQLAGDFSTKLIDEIQSQKQMMAAENGSLNIDMQTTISCDIVSTTANLAMLYNVQKEQIVLSDDLEKIEFKTDKAILARVLTNLMKNAYEAEYQGGKITISCNLTLSNSVCFTVHNPTVMPTHVKEQVFKKSFSTKGTGRGLGTYSIKLLTEKYLGGKVYFESKEPEGTTFYIEIPISK